MKTTDEEAHELLFGAPARAARDAVNASSKFAHAATSAGVDMRDDKTVEVPPLAIDDVDSTVLREALLGAVALAHGRVLAGKFGTVPGEQAGLEKLLAMVERFPEFAKALDTVADYARTTRAIKATKADIKTASETVRKLRVVLNKA